MKPKYEPLVQARIDAYEKRLLQVSMEHYQEYCRKLDKELAPIRKALETLYRQCEGE